MSGYSARTRGRAPSACGNDPAPPHVSTLELGEALSLTLGKLFQKLIGFFRFVRMEAMDDDKKAVCPRFHQAIELVGKRWTGAIIQALMDGPRRYSSLLQAIPGLHDRLLSERLKELETEGIVTRWVYPDTPVRVEYKLSEKGRDLERVLVEMDRWADRWIAETSAQRTVVLGPQRG